MPQIECILKMVWNKLCSRLYFTKCWEKRYTISFILAAFGIKVVFNLVYVMPELYVQIVFRWETFLFPLCHFVSIRKEPSTTDRLFLFTTLATVCSLRLRTLVKRLQLKRRNRICWSGDLKATSFNKNGPVFIVVVEAAILVLIFESHFAWNSREDCVCSNKFHYN